MTRPIDAYDFADLTSTKVITCNHKTGETKSYLKTTLLANRKQLIEIAEVIQDFEEGELGLQDFAIILGNIYHDKLDLSDLGLECNSESLDSADSAM